MPSKKPNKNTIASDGSPTIIQVAQRAGVSTATVSRVLSGADNVTKKLATKVHRAVTELNYQPNRAARTLRIRSTQTIGVIIPNIENSFFTSVVRGIEKTLKKAGYTLLLGNSDEDPKQEQLYLATLRAEGVAGIIFVPVSNEAASYQWLVDAKLPFVVMDRSPPDLQADKVTVNNSAGAQAAVQHLIKLKYKRIGLITGPHSFSTAREREVGYIAAFKESKSDCPFRRELIRQGDYKESGGYEAMSGLLSLREPPDAVFVSNNMMTLGALQAIHERGLRIPNDIAIISFDDMPWFPSLQPPLSAIAQPPYELGTTATELLLARMREPHRSFRHIVLESKLVLRASCGTLRREEGRDSE